jgi:hypothetical protein
MYVNFAAQHEYFSKYGLHATSKEMQPMSYYDIYISIAKFSQPQRSSSSMFIVKKEKEKEKKSHAIKLAFHSGQAFTLLSLISNLIWLR